MTEPGKTSSAIDSLPDAPQPVDPSAGQAQSPLQIQIPIQTQSWTPLQVHTPFQAQAQAQSQTELLAQVLAQAQPPVQAPTQPPAQAPAQPPTQAPAQSPAPPAPAPPAPGPSAAGPPQATGAIDGTVTDVNGEIVPEATVVLEGPAPGDHRSATADQNAAFQFTGLPAGSYKLTVSAKGFDAWTSPQLNLASGQFLNVRGINLKLPDAVTSVTVYSDPVEIATEQVRVAEQQRVLGFIPNFYVVYDSQNAVPLTARLKFRLAFRVAIDPVSFLGAAFLAGIDQAAQTPSYVLGAKGYGQRVGATYTDGFTDIIFGGGILPAVLRQDPRYYYKGTGSTRSRMLHALSYPFVCKGDNGHLQPNYSTIGGDLISSSLSNIYYPRVDRGAGLTFTLFAEGTAERAVSTLLQEFVLRQFTPAAKRHSAVTQDEQQNEQ